MDWDELKPRPKPAIALGESLATLSVAELDARIAALEAEIARVRVELNAKSAQRSAADDLFRKPG
jgi:uncharacterized small protein (DUF1192 family)